MHILCDGNGRAWLPGDSVDWSAPLVFTLPAVLDGDECAAMIAKIDALGPAPAPISTAAGFLMRPDIRNNTRVMFDDKALAAELFARVAASVPQRLFGRSAVGVNERFRCYRYEPGQRFASHFDGAHQRSERERSELTLIVYLNEGFDGGRTSFPMHGVEAIPRTGDALLFQHHLLHEGCTVREGVKYVLRSDVMYADA